MSGKKARFPKVSAIDLFFKSVYRRRVKCNLVMWIQLQADYSKLVRLLVMLSIMTLVSEEHYVTILLPHCVNISGCVGVMGVSA